MLSQFTMKATKMEVETDRLLLWVVVNNLRPLVYLWKSGKESKKASELSFMRLMDSENLIKMKSKQISPTKKLQRTLMRVELVKIAT